jgi:hypothetical protein
LDRIQSSLVRSVLRGHTIADVSPSAPALAYLVVADAGS